VPGRKRAARSKKARLQTPAAAVRAAGRPEVSAEQRGRAADGTPFFGPRGRGRDPQMPEACVHCGTEVGLPYHPDDWVMRVDRQAPGGVVAVCPECAASAPPRRSR